MDVDQPRRFGPGVRAVLGDDEPVEIADDRGTALLRVPGSRDIAVLSRPAPDTAPLLEQADRLLWLAGRGPAPLIVASSRTDTGDESVVIRLGADATPATDGHPMGPEALVEALAASLRSLHARPVSQCPFVADSAELRQVVDRRIGQAAIADAVEGPYVGRPPGALVEIYDELMADLGDADDPVFLHAALAPHRIWLEPTGDVSFLGWEWSGVGDRHLDLAATAAMLTQLHGPALVAPFFDAYGFDHVDLRRLDAHQLLAHLLS